MGVFDKLKNVFFEEEYVEVEEPVKRPKKEKPTIAKKIDLPEMPKLNEEKTTREKEIEEEVVERVERKGITENSLRRSENSFKFPMTFEDDDFKVDTFNDEKPVRSTRVEEVKTINTNSTYSNLYSSKPEEPKEQKRDYTASGLYEGGEYKKNQKVFRPTPIISPIYGILDKNYKKDEIVQKKEVRLTSASSKKVDLDTVREKAYGDLASDITASLMDEVDEVKEKPTNIEEDLYDLTDVDQPIVTNVTVGDAEEYFNDLGLEYNVDYKDNKNEKATGRRSDKIKDTEESEDSLFDLIDSMYKEEEEEE